MTFKSTSPEKFKATLQAAKRGWESNQLGDWLFGWTEKCVENSDCCRRLWYWRFKLKSGSQNTQRLCNICIGHCVWMTVWPYGILLSSLKGHATTSPCYFSQSWCKIMVIKSCISINRDKDAHPIPCMNGPFQCCRYSYLWRK